MFSLLLLSLVLSAPAGAVSQAAQLAVVPQPDALAADASTLRQRADGFTFKDESSPSFDAMEIHPDADVCFKIRAYIFSTGPVPKLLRETTCGPKRGAVKSIEGAKPKLVPVDASGEGSTGTVSPR
jgi:hypothetical protein